MREHLQLLLEQMQRLFTEQDMLIFGIVLAMVTLMPVFLAVFRKRGYVRTLSLIVFAVYIFGNISFTLLNRETMSDQYLILRPMSDFKQAFYLDLGVVGTIRQIINEGFGPAMENIHINSGRMAREVFLNILLYVPLGYLLPFVFKNLRGHIFLITLLGFIASCATEFAQLYYHIGCFQVDDIVTNTLGTLIGAIIGSILTFVWRTK